MPHSSLPSSLEVSNGEYNLFPFENKVAIRKYIESLGIPHITINTPWFAENLWKLKLLHKLPHAAGWEIRTAKLEPDSLFPVLWVRQTFGDAVLTLIQNYRKDGILGKTFHTATETASMSEIAKLISEVIGEPVTHKNIDTFGHPFVDAAYQYLDKFGAKSMPAGSNKELVTLGHQPGSIADFVKTDLKDYMKSISN